MGQVQTGRVFQSHYNTSNTIVYYEWPKEEEIQLTPKYSPDTQKSNEDKDTKTIENKPLYTGIDAIYMKAQNAILFKRYEIAAELVEQIKVHPDGDKYLKSIFIQYYTGYMHEGRQEDALHMLRTAMEKFPDDSAICFHMSNYYAEYENDLDTAIRYAQISYDTAIRLSAFFVTAAIHLIDLYVKNGELNKAKTTAATLKTEIITHKKAENIEDMEKTLYFCVHVFRDRLTPEIASILSEKTAN